jgi:hypothetical protein
LLGQLPGETKCPDPPDRDSPAAGHFARLKNWVNSFSLYQVRVYRPNFGRDCCFTPNGDGVPSHPSSVRLDLSPSPIPMDFGELSRAEEGSGVSAAFAPFGRDSARWSLVKRCVPSRMSSFPPGLPGIFSPYSEKGSPSPAGILFRSRRGSFPGAPLREPRPDFAGVDFPVPVGGRVTNLVGHVPIRKS